MAETVICRDHPSLSAGRGEFLLKPLPVIWAKEHQAGKEALRAVALLALSVRLKGLTDLLESLPAAEEALSRYLKGVAGPAALDVVTSEWAGSCLGWCLE